MTRLVVGPGASPALGDLRQAGPEDDVFVRPEAAERKDFPKLWEAVGVALVRGARVYVINREEST
ncbi:hypothetical protein [Streptomyces sp. R44]|uniref:Uncharacterized protein n=1 Tax=Streptomyces sp. R44 TaxID=3238633 RepID=A0AB39T2J1_9ACTN